MLESNDFWKRESIQEEFRILTKGANGKNYIAATYVKKTLEVLIKASVSKKSHQ